MKNHYKILGLKEGASQEQIKIAYTKLSKELNPANNDNQEFFKEEYEKVQAAYKALYSTSILATEQGARNKNTVAKPISKLEDTPPVSNPNLVKPKKNKIYLSALVVLILVSLVFFYVYNQPEKYKRDQIVFNKELALVKKTMLPLTGRIKDNLYEGLFVEGKRTGHHKIQYKYLVTGEERSRFEWYKNFAEGEFKENLYQGNWVFYHKNNSMYAQGNYIDGNNEDIGSTGVPTSGREGTWRFWHENGQLSSEDQYKNGEREGLYREWHENGQLESEGQYNKGNAEGIYREWHENGQLKKERTYVNAIANGLARNWYNNGQLEIEMTWDNANAQGLVRNWHKNGQLSWEQTHVNGRKQGLGMFWYKNGQLKEKGEYKNGNAEGLFRSWFENGQLDEKGKYKNGYREGIWRFWYKNGKFDRSSNYD